MGHDAGGVGGEGTVEAGDGFLEVEAEAPVESEVEPALRLGGGGGDGAGVVAEVEAVGCGFDVGRDGGGCVSQPRMGYGLEAL